jgi:hypothetical protein
MKADENDDRHDMPDEILQAVRSRHARIRAEQDQNAFDPAGKDESARLGREPGDRRACMRFQGQAQVYR